MDVAFSFTEKKRPINTEINYTDRHFICRHHHVFESEYTRDISLDLYRHFK